MGEIDKTLGEQEKADESGSLPVKPGELASLLTLNVHTPSTH